MYRTRPYDKNDSPLERGLAMLPGWIYLISGLTLLAMAVLTPVWIEVDELAWQRDLMRLQAERLSAQAEQYEQFHLALADDDPVLLEHLAFTQLRLKPAGTELLDPPPLDTAAQGALALAQLNRQRDVIALASAGNGASPPQSPGPASSGIVIPEVPGALFRHTARDGAVDASLARNLAQVGVDVQPLQPINSRLTRLTRGRSRMGLVLAAVVLIVGGAWLHGRE